MIVRQKRWTADRVATTRGIVADPSQIIVLNGAQEGVGLCARLFLDHGSVAVVENPSRQGAVFSSRRPVPRSSAWRWTRRG